jgi:hypothetical protein
MLSRVCSKKLSVRRGEREWGKNFFLPPELLPLAFIIVVDSLTP